MSEDPDLSVPEATPPQPDPVRTGVASVDQVIATVEELDERPLEEHVAVFETAHGELRRALDPTETPNGPA